MDQQVIEKDTKSALLDCAERLFLEHGLEGVSVREITDAAGANVAAINYHFSGKTNLYREVLSRRFEQIVHRKVELLRPFLENIQDILYLYYQPLSCQGISQNLPLTVANAPCSEVDKINTGIAVGAESAILFPMTDSNPGADLVVVNHAHVVQGYQAIEEVLVFYGLGNFVFDQIFSRDHQQGVILLVTFQETTVVGFEFIPTVVLQNGTVLLADEDDAAVIFDQIEASSALLDP